MVLQSGWEQMLPRVDWVDRENRIAQFVHRGRPVSREKRPSFLLEYLSSTHWHEKAVGQVFSQHS